jgi:hypothetical protein
MTLAVPSRPRLFSEIRVKGALDGMWSAWFDGLHVVSDDIDQTVISQAALHGLLSKVRNLGLELLEVRRIDPDWPHA